MQTAVTIIRRHGAPKQEILTGPEISFEEQLVKFRQTVALGTHPEIAEIELWTKAEGRSRHRKLKLPPAPVAQASSPVATVGFPPATTAPGEAANPSPAPVKSTKRK